MNGTQRMALSGAGVLHKYPAYEACNLDATEEQVVDTVEEAMDTGDYKRHCKRCWTSEELVMAEASL